MKPTDHNAPMYLFPFFGMSMQISFRIPHARLRRTAACFALAGASLWAASPIASSAADALPTVIQHAVDSGVKVVKSFPAASGLTGWVLSQGGRYSVVYTTADRKTLIAGALIGENNENLSEQYEEKYVPQPDPSALFKGLEKSLYVSEGTTKDARSVLYVFVDANCPFCHLTWIALQPYEKAGLQVRWIPVATLGPTSMPKAIEMMAAQDRVAALRTMEMNQGKPWSPSAQSNEASHGALAESIRKNGALMEAFGISGTPGIVWKDARGKVHVKAGMPRLEEIPGITGLPEQKQTDPALDRFR